MQIRTAALGIVAIVGASAGAAQAGNISSELVDGGLTDAAMGYAQANGRTARFTSVNGDWQEGIWRGDMDNTFPRSGSDVIDNRFGLSWESASPQIPITSYDFKFSYTAATGEVSFWVNGERTGAPTGTIDSDLPWNTLEFTTVARGGVGEMPGMAISNVDVMINGTSEFTEAGVLVESTSAIDSGSSVFNSKSLRFASSGGDLMVTGTATFAYPGMTASQVNNNAGEFFIGLAKDVPAPGAASLLALSGLAAVRRRRA